MLQVYPGVGDLASVVSHVNKKVGTPWDAAESSERYLWKV